MLFLEPLHEAVAFISDINTELKENYGQSGLSKTAVQWLAFCLTGIAITGTICWDRFQRASAGKWRSKALSWMLHHSTCIPWEKIFAASTSLLIKKFKITSGHLLVDDFDIHRSKRTTKIFGTHKIRSKKGGGFVDAQNIVLLVLVTPFITIPVGFQFYRPDPDFKAWRKNDEALKKKGVKKSLRPVEPPRNINYPSKKEMTATLLRKFKYKFNALKIKSITADSAYLSKKMRADCQRIYPNIQFISQLRSNQNALCPRRGEISLRKYFAGLTTQTISFTLRGGLEKTITFASARLFIRSHGRRYHVVAFKYEGEDQFRFLCASDLTWHAKDIIQTYAWRWLVEVVIEDLKLYHGFGQMAMQQGEDGARKSLLLSLLFDHFLIQHPRQLSLHRAGQPLSTAGSLKNRIQLDCFIQSIEQAIEEI